jgi:TPR repeat protein
MNSPRFSLSAVAVGVLLSTILTSAALAAGEVPAVDPVQSGKIAQGDAALPTVTAVGRLDEDAARQGVPALMAQASELEHAGRYAEACRLYRIASGRGHGPASLRLGELSLQGLAAGHRDYVGAVHWYATARSQGVQLAALDKR